MTNDEQKAQEAQTLLDFSDTQKKIACLTAALKEAGARMYPLVSALQRRPSVATSLDEGGTTYRVRSLTGSGPEEEVAIDLPKIGRLLRELEAAIRKRDGLVESVKEMGHGNMLPENLR